MYYYYTSTTTKFSMYRGFKPKPGGILGYNIITIPHPN